MDCLLLKYNHVSSYYPLLPNESKSLIIIKSFVDNYAHTYRLLSLLFPLINHYRCTAYIKPTRQAFAFKTRIIMVLFKIDFVWIRYALQINWTHCFQYFICNPNTLWHLLIKHWCYLYFLWPLICVCVSLCTMYLILKFRTKALPDATMMCRNCPQVHSCREDHTTATQYTHSQNKAASTS